MRICVCGGGNEAHALAAFLGARPDLEISLLTRRPQLWNPRVLFAEKGGAIRQGKLALVSGDPKDVIPSADMILISLPTQYIPEVLRLIAPFYRRGTWLGSLPGTGGFDWMARKEIPGALVFGTSRVPFECRVKEYGREVRISGKKKKLNVAAIPRAKTAQIAAILADLFEVPVTALDNYLAVTLTTSNALLHPVRLYRLFKDWTPGNYFARPIPFYEEWDDATSEILLKCDAEVQQICRAIPLDLSAILPILTYYEARNARELTSFFVNCPSFKGDLQHFQETNEGYVPNFACRYFKEDFPYGLLILRAIAEMIAVSTPAIDEILFWGQQQLSQQYLLAGKLNIKNIRDAGIPQLFGLQTLAQLIDAVQ